jgi:hypothetical protein
MEGFFRANYLMRRKNHPGSIVRMQQGVLTEPCCVEAGGDWNTGKLSIFIGGSGYENERGRLRGCEIRGFEARVERIRGR